LALISRTSAILLTCIIFFFLFYLSYRKVSKNYQ
jgi:hypothetical protein